MNFWVGAGRVFEIVGGNWRLLVKPAPTNNEQKYYNCSLNSPGNAYPEACLAGSVNVFYPQK
ncbi:MAG TPA: hypothetical protein DD001_00980 [Microcoleaceae bacterium UBA10368]|jgi:hypothetical protein|nr:hypothetical protein [Microcoleaceae cyanobacterium UBA10368]HCV29127.1 hypothetical protein [Microcoleaceae cyanobacterium UBA9251]